jgi:hypothetical protein
MKTIYIFFIFFIFNSCQVGSENEIAIYNNNFFSKKSSEIDKPINFGVKEEYNRYFSLPIQQKKGQIPIFKYFEGKQYKIFMGIPFQLSFQDITNQLISKEKEPLSIFRNDNFSYINYKKNDHWITESVFQIGDSSTVYLSTIQDSVHYLNNKNIFSPDSVKTRFYKK